MCACGLRHSTILCSGSRRRSDGQQPRPRQLQLTPEALIATHLKVTGYVDARDFGTLKAATMTATQELDLSEATICEYHGTDGSYSPITPDWIVGDNMNNFISI